jgi:hypothetical protein
MIAVDQTCVIAPTPNRTVSAAQVVITTAMIHTSTMRNISTKKNQTKKTQAIHDELYAEQHTTSKEKPTHKRIQRNRNKTQKNRKP